MANEVGRPSKYQDSMKTALIEYAETCKKKSKGLINSEIADIIGVSEGTVRAWMAGKPDFLAAVKAAKNLLDDFVEASLFQNACGYSHTETIVKFKDGEFFEKEIEKHYKPDTIAGIFWLKNRQPERWREKMPSDNTFFLKDGDASKMTDEELDIAMKGLLAKAQAEQKPDPKKPVAKKTSTKKKTTSKRKYVRKAK